MPIVKIDSADLVIFEGTAKNGKNTGKPYSMIKLDRQFSNNKSYINQLKELGVKVYNSDSKTMSDGSKLAVE